MEEWIRVRPEDKIRLLTHSIEVEKESGVCPRGEPSSKKELVFIITSVIIVPTRNFVLHVGLGILHKGIEPITALLLGDLAEAIKIQNFCRGRHRPTLHLV